VGGFTLADLLITLGIIGIVAALTLPSLIQHYKKQEASTRLKKFYSSILQARMLSENENGSIDNWETPTYTGAEATKKWFLQYFAPYMKYSNITTEEIVQGIFQTVVWFADGSSMRLNNGSCMDMAYDINSLKKPPNTSGRDIFWFLFCPAFVSNHCNQGEYFCTYNKNLYTTRESALNGCKNQTVNCSTLLLFDNWEFKDDYPNKL
jgi:type II secretory pathway pseudopilin PulG